MTFMQTTTEFFIAENNRRYREHLAHVAKLRSNYEKRKKRFWLWICVQIIIVLVGILALSAPI